MDFSRRSTLPEMMDDAGLDAAEYRRCLSDLAAVNRLTCTHRATLKWLNQATKDLAPGASFTLLDVAYGHGDLLRAIHLWAEKRGLLPELSGIDLNPGSRAAAMAATPAQQHITYYTGDVFDFTPDKNPDFIVTSQFTHHLPDEQIVRLLRWMQSTARRGWHILDLHRHVLAYYGFAALARAAGWHRIVREDGMVSVARAFRRADWEELLAASGTAAEVKWHLPFRYSIAKKAVLS
jgi:2-polyprenyl-3-methyl-5-hydroxy-6-metoxy-1,4-benzoquinol methylase